MKSHFSMLARYNAWANTRLYKMVASLPDASYRRDVGVYFKSLHGTLNHVLVADRIWMRRLTGQGQAPNKLNEIICDDLTSLQAARTAEDTRILSFVDSLEHADFEKACEYRMLNG